jgi:predicted DsbA family dithiol-disulfide isomerase
MLDRMLCLSFLCSSYGGDTRGTTNSHRILHRTLTQLGPEKQLAVIDELFAAYFEHERDPADPELLADAAVHVGLFPDAPAARAYLDGTEDRADVEDQFRFAQMKGISGVPFFEITAEGVGARISGAQDREVFADVFGRIADKLRELGKLPEGAKASVDGVQADGPACAADGQTC